MKSYLFSSESYSCGFEEELKDITIHLPDRTVLQAKEDICSLFYITFVEKKEFRSFYEKELTRLESSGLIKNYYFVEEGVRGQQDRIGLIAELTSGANIVISFYPTDVNHLAITYLRDN